MNSSPLSAMSFLGVMLCWVYIMVLNFCTCVDISYLFLRMTIYTNLVWSSRIVKKKLWLWTETMANGPHMSKRINSNLEFTIVELCVKGSLFFLAKWQILKVDLLSNERDEYNTYILISLLLETCLSLTCQRIAR